MTLRDDIVFFILLYQSYLYPVDKSRPDEYGYVHAEEGQSVTAAAIQIQ